MDVRTGMLCLALSALVILLVSCTNAAKLEESAGSETPNYADRFNEFDWHISKAIGGSIKNNVILSPISVKLVLAMLYEGASGTTAKELADVLKIEKGPAPSQRFSNIFQSLQGSDSGYELHVGMKLFIDKEAKAKKSYATKISNLYNATIDSINFKNTAEAVAQVNSWAHSVTRGHIQHLLTEADAHHSTLMLLLNAVYFKGLWQYPFPINNTKEGVFTTEQNVPVTVDYMNGVQTVSYHDSIELKSSIIRLPYVGDKFAMYIILPDQGTTLNEVIANLTPTKVRSSLSEMMQVPVNISLPKFNFEFASSLAPVLKQVGINEIFSNKADLRNIAEGPRDPVVSNVIQKAAIEINELGTVAAVVSAAELVNKFGMHTVSFNASRPFLFFIEDEKTNTVIFIGKVVNPVALGKPIVSAAVPATTTANPSTSKTSQSSSSLKPAITTTSETPVTDPALLSGSLAQRVGPIPSTFYNFDFQLLQELSHQERDNWVISPASIKTTLGLILEGASGSTATEISRVLRISRNVTVARDELRRIQQRIQDTPNGITVNSGNVMLAKQGLGIKNKFRTNANRYYSADITVSDFSKGQLVSKEVNKWINTLTKGNIPEIVQPGSITPGTILMLANAVYFKGNWKVEFKTRPSENCFYSPDCDMVQMMGTTGAFKYGEIKSLNARVLEMPYEDPRYSMIILLPRHKQGIQDIAIDIQFNSIISLIDNLVSIEVNVIMPKFAIEYSLEMKPLLQKYALEKIFSNSADFSELFQTGTRAKVSSFLHKARIEVTEKGTVAAGATVAQFQLLSTSNKPNFIVDHPFFFFIRDSQAGFLFQGQINHIGDAPSQVRTYDSKKEYFTR